ncbi:MAG TPA: anhydro-N-acetylmuramic acid kinase, partial [Gemmatimonadales bacterium]|nr:anhydro-N-acetylmuramic acid kinase [Gemmatimonadales bacterium]
VPMADVLLFGHPDHGRVLLNIGGMANFTHVPRRALEIGTLACDTGPGVAVIDAVARLVDPTLGFDVDGRLARRGRADETVLAKLLADPFFAARPPKSTGRERFGPDYARALHREVPGVDGVATAVELTARTIADAIRRFAPDAPEVIGSGGGMRHPVLVERLTTLLKAAGVPLLNFDDLFFTGGAKEAVAFALLGYLCIHGQPGNLPSATGASGSRILGQITPA